MGLYDRDYLHDDDAPEWRRSAAAWPVVNYLVAANVAVFVLDAFLPDTDAAPSRWLSYTLALKIDDLFAQPWMLWTLLTHGFAHSSLSSPGGIWHVLFNSFVLWMFGRDVEARLGKGEFLRFYLAAIVFAGLVWLGVGVLLGRTNAYAVGASGAVTAVLAYFAILYPRRTLLLFMVVPMPAWMLVAFIVGVDILSLWQHDSGVAHEAHLAGAAFAGLYYLGGLNLTRWTPLPTHWRLPLRSRTKLRMHRPPVDDDEDDLAATADRLLDKIHREGEASLTARERKILENYSRRIRQKLK